MLSLRKIDETMLREWCERDERRRELEREARQLKSENDLVAKDIQAVLEAEEKYLITRGGYRCELEAGRPTVSWKDEFIRREGSEAAAAIVAAAPVPRHCKITPIGV